MHIDRSGSNPFIVRCFNKRMERLEGRNERDYTFPQATGGRGGLGDYRRLGAVLLSGIPGSERNRKPKPVGIASGSWPAPPVHDVLPDFVPYIRQPVAVCRREGIFAVVLRHVPGVSDVHGFEPAASYAGRKNVHGARVFLLPSVYADYAFYLPHL